MPSDDRGGDFVQLLELIKTLQPKSTNKGNVIFFNEILRAGKPYGLTKDLLHYKLNELQSKGLITIHRTFDDTDPKDVITGISIEE